jgi:hypothetical protein
VYSRAGKAKAIQMEKITISRLLIETEERGMKEGGDA